MSESPDGPIRFVDRKDLHDVVLEYIKLIQRVLRLERDIQRTRMAYS